MYGRAFIRIMYRNYRRLSMQRRAKFIDLVCLLTVMLIVSAWTIAADVSSREIARRVKCASNLRQIGMGLLLYANENRGAYPRTVFDVQHADQPTWDTPYKDDAKLD